MTKFNVTIASAAFIAAGLCVGAATGAAAEPVTLTAKVSYAGLDLASDAGRATMDRRVKQVAHQLCGHVRTERLWTVREQNARCTREIVDEANAKLMRVEPTAIASR